MHSHRLLTPGLAKIDDLFYLEIGFTFSDNPERQVNYRLVFSPPSLDPVAAETMHNLLGNDVSTLCVSVVSFADTVQLEKLQEQLAHPVEGEEPVNIFAKPDNAFDLDIGELQYLYRTLVDFMLKVAENEGIQVLFFSAEREELVATYKRYVERMARQRGLTYINDGVSYAIRTQHYPKEG